MIRPATYLFPAILAGILVFLALPGSVWATPASVSSIIERDFQQDLDARQTDSRLWMAESDRFEDLVFSAVPRKLWGSSTPVGAELKSASDVAVAIAGTDWNPARNPGWELAAYEAIQAHRHGMVRAAERFARSRERDAVQPRNGGLRDGSQSPSNRRVIQAGSPAVAGTGSTNASNLRSTGPLRTLAALSARLTDAPGAQVAGGVQLFYFAFRNGYAGNSFSFSLHSFHSFYAARTRFPGGVFYSGALT